ncbi:MAG: HEPN domain-containing protein [Methanothrix sp.]|nr:HEPN domain-containing protein [Methanothrix sp.]
MGSLSRLRLVDWLEGGDLITAYESAIYRLKVAQGFLEESSQDLQLGRWRSAVDNAQLAVENSAKAVLSLVVPIGKTHNPAPQLRDTLSKGHFSADIAEKIERLAESAEQLGFDVHIQTDYGDETGRLTPWDLFDENDARQAQSLAQESVDLADAIVREVRRG